MTDDPIYSYEVVLGAAVGAWGDSANCDGVDVKPFGLSTNANALCRRYFAAWARRNLFEGQP